MLRIAGGLQSTPLPTQASSTDLQRRAGGNPGMAPYPPTIDMDTIAAAVLEGGAAVRMGVQQGMQP